QGDRVVVALLEDRLLGLRDDRGVLVVVALGDAVLEEERVDAEAVGQPFEGPLRRTRLAGLDLADVLLRDSRLGELGLRQPALGAQAAQAVAERALRAGERRRRLCGRECAAVHRASCSACVEDGRPSSRVRGYWSKPR